VLGAVGGCLKNPGNGGRGYSSIPKVMIDYDLDSACFKIYVKSAVGDYKYDYIKITVNDNEKIENNTYVLSYNCVDTDFSLEAEAQVDVDVIYFYTCEITLTDDKEKDIFLTITDKTDIIEKEITVSQGDMPWKKILVQKS
jgi:hypothetical protein